VPPEHLPINFRDFGGVRTTTGSTIKQGALYRSGAPAQPGALAALQAVGIRTLIDLRSRQERGRALPRWPDAALASLPMDFDRSVQRRIIFALLRRDAVSAVYRIVEGVYRETVDQARPQIAGLFRLLSDPGAYPAVIFCRAGRDRTGFAVAVVQLALDVAAEDVVAEYLRSNAFLLPQAQRAVAMLQRLPWGPRPARILRAVFDSQERYIRSVIGKIEEDYGGIAGYLRACKIEGETVEVMKKLLLELQQL